MSDSMQKKLPPIFTISIALHMSIVIYVVVAFLLSRQAGWDPGWRIREGNEVLFLALLVPTMLTGILSVVFPRLAGKTGDAVTIVRMALAESIAIFGLVLSFINQSRLIIVPFAIVALIVQFLVGPIYEKLRSADDTMANPYS